MRGPVSRPMKVKVWGDYACFTRPEMKVERVSYSVMTPSAARGVLESIFWKPEISWQVDEIWVLNPVRYASIMRNEIKDRQSSRSARQWAGKGGGYDVAARRTQRHSLVLRDVAYVIVARIAPASERADPIGKYAEQFARRVAGGRCFATPYLGCREFPAFFDVAVGSDRPIQRDADLGRMLLDIDYEADGSGRGSPVFFEARLRGGVLRVPDRIARVD